MAALGVTAALAATGFIGKLALQQFLGIELGNWTALDLSIFAGRWAIDTVTIILDHLLAHPFLFGISIFLYLIPILIAFSLPSKDPVGLRANRVSIILATLGLIFALTWCEMPTLSLNDWLTTPLANQLNDPGLHPGLLKQREADLRVILLVSKMNGVADQSSVCGRSGDQLPYILRSNLTTRYPAQTARANLENLYAACVVICLTALFTLYFHQTVDQPLLVDELFRGIRLFASLLLLPLVACLIPYMYGKLLYPTTFPEVTMAFASKQAADKAPAATKPSGNESAGDPSSVRMLIMDETDKEISLLSVESPLPYTVQILHRDDIKSMQRYGSKDVLNTMLIRCQWLPQLEQPSPAVP